MARPLFTVIMPTYQRRSMLPSAVKTLLSQTCPDFECLIVDDGSTDGTDRLVASLGLDARFKYTRLEHVGNMYCRNWAIERAQGEWITYLDSDDFWHDERLAEFKAAIEKRPSVGFWFSNGFLWRYGRLIGVVFDSDGPVPEGRVPGHYAVGTEFLPYITTNVAIRRSLFTEYGLYRKDMVILDNELYARMFDGGVEVGVIRKPLAVRRIHDQQVTHLWVEEFPEALDALKAGNPAPEVFAQERVKLVEEIAQYLVKSAQPGKARAFMLQHLGEDAKKSRWWKWTALPAAALKGMKTANKALLMARWHPALQPPEWRAVQKRVAALIADEKNY